uniref:Uncharacterized protein n=1 Tax=Onchocerca volvulus TaxID=6282 RepID=A0A8R1XPZ3_ONCVO
MPFFFFFNIFCNKSFFFPGNCFKFNLKRKNNWIIELVLHVFNREFLDHDMLGLIFD